MDYFIKPVKKDELPVAMMAYYKFYENMYEKRMLRDLSLKKLKTGKCDGILSYVEPNLHFVKKNFQQIASGNMNLFGIYRMLVDPAINMNSTENFENKEEMVGVMRTKVVSYDDINDLVIGEIIYLPEVSTSLELENIYKEQLASIQNGLMKHFANEGISIDKISINCAHFDGELYNALCECGYSYEPNLDNSFEYAKLFSKEMQRNKVLEK